MRGEHATAGDQTVAVSGSSPHAWGTQSQRIDGDHVVRFIPTCVGNTPRIRRCRIQSAVHPHMRGEHLLKRQKRQENFGSSPHAWGTLAPLKTFFLWKRFIPTCVGNTIDKQVNTKTGAVHPHMRGEHLKHNPNENITSGSSPHAWGTRVVADRHGIKRRFIPTCVGNTLRRKRPFHGYLRS